MQNTELRDKINKFTTIVGKIESEQAASLRARQQLELSIEKIMADNASNKEALDIATHAIEILRQVSDEAVTQAYRFLEGSLNASLERMFNHTTRKIRLKEYTRNNQYPQLELELTVGNGKIRSLKSDSGHGLAQIVSLLSILSLIVITNSRRLLVLDEVVSGLSIRNRRIISDILWTFTGIGFQFLVNEHGYVPVGSKVYHVEMIADVSHIKESYIEERGVYLNAPETKDDGEVIEKKPIKEAKQEDVENNNVTSNNIVSI